jgi:ATP-binding cassette subfamily B protein
MTKEARQPLATKSILFGYFRKNWGRYASGIALVFASTWSTMRVPDVLGRAIDLLRAPPAEGAPARAALALPAGAGRQVALLAAFAALAFVTKFLWRYLVLGFCRGAETFLRQRLFAHLEAQPAAFYMKYNTGDIITRAISDTNALRRMIGFSLVTLVDAVTIFGLAAATLLGASDAAMAAMAILPVPLLVFAITRIRRGLRERQRAIRVAASNLAAKAQEDLAGIRVVKAFAREGPEAAAFARLSRARWRAEMRMARLSNVIDPMARVVFGGVFAAYIVVGSRLVARGAVTLGEFTAFNGTILLMINPVAAVGRAIEHWQNGVASVARLDELFHERPGVGGELTPGGAGIGDPPPPEGAGVGAGVGGSVGGGVGAGGARGGAHGRPGWRVTEGALELRGLTFSYPGGPPVLRGVSLKVRPGESVAITGPTGCGKSTLASLIARRWPVPDGMIFVDRRDVNQVPVHALREALGYVPQDVFLFSASVMDNIRFYSERVTEAEALRAAEAVRLDEDVARLAGGYGAVVGERGLSLSGGQMQRVSIARALATRPRILLLDDCLSAVDARTERAILAGLGEYLEGAATILITHRVAACALADRVLVLGAGGAPAEEGTYAQLAAAGGAFAALVRMQAGQGAAP